MDIDKTNKFEWIKTATAKYRQAEVEYDASKDLLNATKKTAKLPDVMYDEHDIIRQEGGDVEAEILFTEVMRAYYDKQHLYFAAMKDLLSAMPFYNVWYKVVGGFVRKLPRNEVEFVSDGDLLNKLKGGE